MCPDLTLELAAGGLVCGIDEAGRGPLAGPVTAAAVIIPPSMPPDLLEKINDSKALRPKVREELYERIVRDAIVGQGQASVAEIDDINILQATLLAMRRAVGALPVCPGLALVDGNRPPILPCAVRCVVKGDSLSISIAAASIVAKVTRDRIMQDLARLHPGYGWERNAAYGTKEHLDAMQRLGITDHHRKSFAPVRALIR